MVLLFRFVVLENGEYRPLELACTLPRVEITPLLFKSFVSSYNIHRFAASPPKELLICEFSLFFVSFISFAQLSQLISSIFHFFVQAKLYPSAMPRL